MMKSFNAKLYFSLVLMFLIPSIYKTFRIYFLGDLPTDFGYNVASQIAWLNVLFEVVQEALILPLFYLIGGAVHRKEEFDNKIKTGIISTGFVYSILIAFIFFSAEELLFRMDQKESLIDLSSKYIKLESITIFFISHLSLYTYCSDHKE